MVANSIPSIAEQIRTARERLNLSQNELGRRIDMTGKTIWKIEQGSGTTTETLEKIGAVLGITIQIPRAAS